MVDPAILAPATAWQAARAEGIAWWEKALAIAGFLICFNTFQTILSPGSSDRTNGSALFQLLSGGVYLSAMVVLLARGIPDWAIRVTGRSWPLVVLTLLPLVSTIWSDAPGTSLRRAIALLLSSAFAVFLLVRFSPRGLFNLLVIAFAIHIGFGVLAAAAGPGIASSGAYAGAWRGFTGQKNAFGRTMALAVALLPIAAAIGLVSRRRWTLLVSVLALASLLLARSATALVAAFASIGVGTTLYVGLGGRIGKFRLKPELGISFLLIAAIAGALLVIFGWTAILEALGRDPSLTGRTKLWQWAMALNHDRPWLGAGYRAFWIDSNTKYFFEFFNWNADLEGNRSETFAGPEHSHSGYVDMYVEFGRLGVAVLTVTIVAALIALRRAIVRGSQSIGFIFAVILSFLLIYAITERSFLQRSEDLWFLFTMFYLLATKETILPKNSQ